VVLYIATSADGFIADKSDAIDWLFTDEDYGYTSFAETIDTVLMGRRSYEQCLTFGDWPYAGKTCIVFSHYPKKCQSNNSATQVTNEEPGRVVARLRKEEGQDLWLMGGGELVASFLEHNLIDKIILSIHPILLGSGIPLSGSIIKRTEMRLISCEHFKSGLVQLCYETLYD
jgi:dihydrofolate reductase